MTIDNIQDSIVLVHTGSGCLFQPMTEEDCTYVLTAKHIFLDDDQQLVGDEIMIQRSRLAAGGREVSPIPFGRLKTGVNYFPHPGKDVAMLKIAKQEGLDCVIRSDDLLTDRTGYILGGYPEVRRIPEQEFSEWYRNNDVIIKNESGDFREAKVDGHPLKEEVEGQSGGGIVKLIGRYLQLAGIQNRMAPGKEQLGNIHFSPLSCFDEIIKLYPDDLAPLYAPYLRCFSFLRDYVFDLQAGFFSEDVEHARQYLKEKTASIVNSKTTPYAIKEFFQTKLLVDKQSPEVLQTRSIWIAWLEFLIILNIVKDKSCTEAELEEVFNSFRLLYADTDKDWSEEIPNIITSDYRGLRENGLVVIGTPNKPHNDGYVLDFAIPSIARVYKQRDRSKLKIDDGLEFALEKFRFVHLDYFKNKSISKKYEEYRNINSDAELLAKLKSEYEQLFQID